MARYKLSTTGKKQLKAVPTTKIRKNGRVVYLDDFTDEQIDAIGGHVFFVNTSHETGEEAAADHDQT